MNNSNVESEKSFADLTFGANGLLDQIFNLLALENTNNTIINQCLLIAFQILDDYLDAFSDTGSAFGKTIGGDILNDKKTLLWILSRSVAAEPILSLPSNHPEYSKHKIEAYLNWFKVTGAKDECIKRVTAYHDRAKNRVPDLSKNPEIQDLFYKLLYDLQQRLT